MRQQRLRVDRLLAFGGGKARRGDENDERAGLSQTQGGDHETVSVLTPGKSAFITPSALRDIDPDPRFDRRCPRDAAGRF
jgi:hypothetical protein